jgi:hypothetical protein
MTVRERKLGREKASGLCHADGLIDIDPRLRSRDRMDTLCHEVIHHVRPDESVADGAWLSASLPSGLWREGYRRINP